MPRAAERLDAPADLVGGARLLRIDAREAREPAWVARDQLADVVVRDAAPRRAGVLAHDHAQVDPGLVHLVDEELERALDVGGARAASDRERIHLDRVDDVRARAIEVDVEEARERAAGRGSR